MVECGSVVVFGRSLLCVCVCYRTKPLRTENMCVYPYWEEKGGRWNGGGGICPRMVNRLAIKGKSMAAANVGVRRGGDGVDSCVQVGVIDKTLGGLVFV